jgi:hypothetical protein
MNRELESPESPDLFTYRDKKPPVLQSPSKSSALKFRKSGEVL